jgi:hypothetical protein
MRSWAFSTRGTGGGMGKAGLDIMLDLHSNISYRKLHRRFIDILWSL